MSTKLITDYPYIVKGITVLRVVSRPKGKAKVEAICFCGKVFETCQGNLRNGNTHSCGCLKRKLLTEQKTTHGMTDSQMYSIWTTIKSRCNNPNRKCYGNYGGRGIGISDDWLDFSNFLRDMVNPPFKGAQIDRIDNSKGYSKENCRWASAKENTRNTRNNVYIDNVPFYLMTDVGQKYGLNYEFLRNIGRRKGLNLSSYLNHNSKLPEYELFLKELHRLIESCAK